jgi:UPF0042 nucleotide-binding protein
LIVNFLSFGFKHGPPEKTDLLLDVRFLPNPYYIPDLQATTGLEPATAAYALENEAASTFFTLLTPLLNFLVQQSLESKREAMTICIGCTGGRHRSVAVVEKLAAILDLQGSELVITHRDLHKK